MPPWRRPAVRSGPATRCPASSFQTLHGAVEHRGDGFSSSAAATTKATRDEQVREGSEAQVRFRRATGTRDRGRPGGDRRATDRPRPAPAASGAPTTHTGSDEHRRRRSGMRRSADAASRRRTAAPLATRGRRRRRLAAVPAGAPGGGARRRPAAAQPLPGEWWWKRDGRRRAAAARARGQGVTVAVIDGPIDPRRPRARRARSSRAQTLLPRPREGRPRQAAAPVDGDRPGRRARDEHGGAHRRHRARAPAPAAGASAASPPTPRSGTTPCCTRRPATATGCGLDFRRLATTSTGPSADAVSAGGRRRRRRHQPQPRERLQPGRSATPSSPPTAHDADRRRRAPATPRAASQWPGLGNGVVLVNPIGPGRPDHRLRRARAAPYLGLAAPGEDVMAGALRRLRLAQRPASARAPRSPRRSSAAASPPSGRRTRTPRPGRSSRPSRTTSACGPRRRLRLRDVVPPGRAPTCPQVRSAQHGLRLGHLRPRRRRARSTPRPCRRTTPSSATDATRTLRPTEIAAVDRARHRAAASASRHRDAVRDGRPRRRRPAGRRPPARRAGRSGTPWLPVALGAVLVLVVGRRRGPRAAGAAARVAPPPAPPTEPHRRPPRRRRTSQGAAGAEGRNH